ncbi:MAG: nodulation protein NfeD [Candidatus Eisenbacteria bacterium]|uniref:Nodulation protein NfeD n=1 Tax=Eiseniibacteriota bacterium TaxID=2212470 RepID=A0A538T7S2_UNCEI|nr:MAG: nodulation protein NfeD [Candidatus Eisenbacteria bacterium]
MRRLAAAAWAAILLLGAAPPARSTSTAPAKEKPVVDVLTVEGAIQPISAQVIVQAIARAERDKREALIIRLDTPGGLDTAMRDIIKRILVSEVPVVVYVAPAGSRAASAGTFIAYAAHVAAMSPGTSIGAATPVNLGGGDTGKDLARKVRNDAVSYIRSLAAQRGRNADWAEKAVREGGSLPEDEALRLHVIDYIARDLNELLRRMDGRRVTVAGLTRTLHTKDAVTHEVAASWRQKILGRILDPNIAYILFILGFYGILFELSNPGAILPGIVGGICLLLAFLAFQALPVSMTGLFLILFAMLLFAADIKVQSHGLLAVGGVVSLVLGSLVLLSGDGGAMRVSLSVIVTVTVATMLFFAFVVGAGVRALKRKPLTGREGLVGERGVALTELGPHEGRIFVHGEYWEAEADERIEKGAPVVVDRVDGMRLRVRRA